MLLPRIWYPCRGPLHVPTEANAMITPSIFYPDSSVHRSGAGHHVRPLGVADRVRVVFLHLRCNSWYCSLASSSSMSMLDQIICFSYFLNFNVRLAYFFIPLFGGFHLVRRGFNFTCKTPSRKEGNKARRKRKVTDDCIWVEHA